jgi:hypothetical protein
MKGYNSPSHFSKKNMPSALDSKYNADDSEKSGIKWTWYQIAIDVFKKQSLKIAIG